MKLVSDVVCPVCDALPDEECVYARPGSHRPHEARFTLSRGYPGLAVLCPTCDQPPGALCHDLRTRKTEPRFVVWPHYLRDTAAFVARAGETVPGLQYEDGVSVRAPWISADRTRKKDALRSVRFSVPGFLGQTFWGCTYDGKLWVAHAKRNVALHEAARRRFASPVDALGDLTRRATTIWVD
jgi:hypothetical protein